MRVVIVIFCLSVFAPLLAAESKVYVYPARGQSDAEQAQDRYRCHQWAVQSTGFNPVQAKHIKPPQWVAVPENPNAGATHKGLLGGALAGAVIGEVDANNPGRGAVIGAVVGSLLGGALEREGARQSRGLAQRERRALAQDYREQAIAQGNYRRALAACLEGRGYSVN